MQRRAVPRPSLTLQAWHGCTGRAAHLDALAIVRRLSRTPQLGAVVLLALLVALALALLQRELPAQQLLLLAHCAPRRAFSGTGRV